MNIKRYQNELIVLLAFILMLAAYLYKNHQVTQQTQKGIEIKHSLSELKEVVALEKIWGNKKISKKVDALKNIVSASKVKWSKKGTKATATYTGLNPNELNKLTTKIINTPIIITLLEIVKTESTYNMEFKCKW